MTSSSKPQSSSQPPPTSQPQPENSQPLYENLPRYPSAPPAYSTANSAPTDFNPAHNSFNSAPTSLPLPDNNRSTPNSRRSSLILMAPKPFTPYQEAQSRPYYSEMNLNSQPTTHDGGLERSFRSEEILNEAPNSSAVETSTREEFNPYVNENPEARRNYENSSMNGQFHAKPFVGHQRDLSGVSSVSGVSDPMTSSQSSGLNNPGEAN